MKMIASEKGMTEENDLIQALGMAHMTASEAGIEEDYDDMDLSHMNGPGHKGTDRDSEADLDNLAEIVPDVKSRSQSRRTVSPEVRLTGMEHVNEEQRPSDDFSKQKSMHSMAASAGIRRDSMGNSVGPFPGHGTSASMRVQGSRDVDDYSRKAIQPTPGYDPPVFNHQEVDDSNHDSFAYADSDGFGDEGSYKEQDVPDEFRNMSSGNSISTATQTHEVRMPMYLPTFKPATGCTNASDFIVRCFVARLRCGITVVKHGRSRWCKSRLRVLHIHPDGRSLTWKPAEGEPNTSKRPPKLDLSTCLEVRHAWSPDPQNPMYTGTPILRQKCEPANAHKSFALIFKQRTVDITAVTADQCKVLMEGFSALCFRLQVANLAERGARSGHARPMPEEDGVSTTASNTLTNTSTPRGRG